MVHKGLVGTPEFLAHACLSNLVVICKQNLGNYNMSSNIDEISTPYSGFAGMLQLTVFYISGLVRHFGTFHVHGVMRMRIPSSGVPTCACARAYQSAGGTEV